MAYNPKKIKYIRDKVAGLTQEDMSGFLKMKRGTYAVKEAKGDFTPEQFSVILKRTGMTEQSFEAYNVPGSAPIELSTPEMLITIEAKLDVTLSAIAEILAKQNGQSVVGTRNDLLKVVKERYDQKIDELLKPRQ